MHKEESAAEVAFDEYQNVDFTPRFPFPVPSTNGHSPTAVKPSRRLSLWRALRKLIRRRQDSVALAFQRSVVVTAINDAQREIEDAKRSATKEIERVRNDASKEIALIAKRIESRDRALDELRQRLERETGQLRETIASREHDIKNHVELEIPKLKRELEVEREYSKHLAALVKKKLVHEEAEIAIEVQRGADAEGPANNTELMAIKRMMRGDRE